MNPPGLGSKCGKWVERFSDFGKYKGNFRNHTTSLPTYRTLNKWGKWVDRLSDFGKYKEYIRSHSISLPAYRTLSQVQGADLAVSYVNIDTNINWWCLNFRNSLSACNWDVLCTTPGWHKSLKQTAFFEYCEYKAKTMSKLENTNRLLQEHAGGEHR